MARIAEPQVVTDIGENIRMMVTEWVQEDSTQELVHFGDQVCEGHINPDVVCKLAVTLARLNLAFMDDKFHDAVAASTEGFCMAFGVATIKSWT